VLEGTIDSLTEIARWYGMEMTVEKTKVVRISRQPSPVKIMMNKKQPENVKHFNYLGSMMINDARYTREIKFRIAIGKPAFNKKKTFHQQIELVVPRLWDGRPRNIGSISSKLERFFSSPKHLDWSCGPPSLLCTGLTTQLHPLLRLRIRGVKLPLHHSLSCRASGKDYLREI
jgi:hypothetical protein